MRFTSFVAVLLAAMLAALPGPAKADHLSDENMKEVVWSAVENSSFLGFRYPGATASALAACIDWQNSTPDEILVNGYNFYWGASGDVGYSMLNAQRDCEQKNQTRRNCTCQIVDLGGEHQVKVPEWWRRKFDRH